MHFKMLYLQEQLNFSNIFFFTFVVMFCLITLTLNFVKGVSSKRTSKLISQFSQYFKIFTSFCLHTATQVSCFSNAIGVGNKFAVSDNMMTASTMKRDYSARHGRLNGRRAWCTQSARGTREWFMIELETSTEICGVATQGREDTDEYVISFKLYYSLDGDGWTAYQNSNGYDEVDLLFCLEGR